MPSACCRWDGSSPAAFGAYTSGWWACWEIYPSLFVQHLLETDLIREDEPNCSSAIISAMIKTIVLPGLAALGLAICLFAQSEADYPGLMKDIGATKGKITKGIAAKQNAEVAAGAEHLADVFKKVGAFWSSRKTDDAVTL